MHEQYKNVLYWGANVSEFTYMFGGMNKDVLTALEITPVELYTIFETINGYRDVAWAFTDNPAINNETAFKIRRYIFNLSNTNKYKYITLANTEKQEYNPIENYSMVETGTDTRTPNLTHTEKTDYTNSGKTDNTSESVTGVTTYDNTADFINQTKGNDTANTTTSANGTNNRTLTDTGNEKTAHEFKRSGNIGVTTSQQMLQAERDIANFSAVSVFLDDVANLICLSIYDND